MANDASTFAHHRLALAVHLRSRGWQVAIAVPPGTGVDALRGAGLQVEQIAMPRQIGTPWSELTAIWQLSRVIRRLRPQVVHAIALKAIASVGFASVFARFRGAVYTVSGLGYVFSSSSRRARLMRPLLVLLTKLAARKSRSIFIFENPDDQAEFGQLHVVNSRNSAVIRSTGLDVSERACLPEPAETQFTVLMASRLLVDKGVNEFAQAGKLLRSQGHLDIRLVLAGDVDPGNKASIPRSLLERWDEDGLVDWIGWQDDLIPHFKDCHVVCLPSYREGVPRVLMEAAAHCRALIATDVPGCREICRDRRNGVLIPARDAAAIAAAIVELKQDAVLRTEMAKFGRRLVEQEFSNEVVFKATMSVYRQVLAD